MERRVKPLPPAIGATVFLAGIVALGWFFLAGHNVFGPVATRKVRLLMESAKSDNAAGIAMAASQGLYINFRKPAPTSIRLTIMDGLP